MQEFYNKTIREIAVEYPQTTRVFEEFKIDYCCQGNRAFDDACQSAGVAPQIVGGKIAEVLNKSDEDSEAPGRKSASDLADYIVEKHHVFTRNEIEHGKSLPQTRRFAPGTFRSAEIFRAFVRRTRTAFQERRNDTFSIHQASGNDGEKPSVVSETAVRHG
jgi:hypothetical protein